MSCKNDARGCVESFMNVLEPLEAIDRSNLDIWDVDFD